MTAARSLHFTVTFTAPEGKTVNSIISYLDGAESKSILPTVWTEGIATAEITLKHGETVTFNNIPYGVEYDVAENDYTVEGYDEVALSVKDSSGEDGVIDSAQETVTATNNKGTETIDTGITLDSMPYVLVLACVSHRWRWHDREKTQNSRLIGTSYKICTPNVSLRASGRISLFPGPSEQHSREGEN